MATFQLFPRFAPEIRFQIWACAIQDRVIRVQNSGRGFWSPSPVPAVTRACHESRKHCSFQKSFISGTVGGRYIWVNFDYDTIHLRSIVLWRLNRSVFPLGDIKHLRIELADQFPRNQSVEDAEHHWCYHDREILRDFPKLESIDLLVRFELRNYSQWIDENFWGRPMKKNVRIINMSTGDWFDGETAGVYIDYIESWGGKHLDGMTRLVEWDVDEESRKERLEDILQFQIPRPINLDYQ